MCFSQQLKLFLKFDLGAYGTWSSNYAMMQVHVCVCVGCLHEYESSTVVCHGFQCVLTTPLESSSGSGTQAITGNNLFHGTFQTTPTLLGETQQVRLKQVAERSWHTEPIRKTGWLKLKYFQELMVRQTNSNKYQVSYWHQNQLFS